MGFLTREAKEKKVFLLDEILMTSSKVPEEKWVQRISEILISMTSDEDLIKSRKGLIPLSWSRLLSEMKNSEKEVLEMSEIDNLFEDVKKTTLTPDQCTRQLAVQTREEDVLNRTMAVKDSEYKINKQSNLTLETLAIFCDIKP